MTDQGEVNDGIDKVGAYAGIHDSVDDSYHLLSYLVSRSFGVADIGWFDVFARDHGDFVTGFERDVLTLDSDITVRRTDGDAREGIDIDRTKGGVDVDAPLVAHHLDLIQAVAVADVDTACQILVFLTHAVQRGESRKDGGIKAHSRRDGIGDETGADRGIGEGDVVTVGRHDLHRDVFPLQLRRGLTVQPFVRRQSVLREQTAHHVWTLHVVAVEVDKHLVADTRSEEGTATRCSHRRGHTDPWGRHRLVGLVDILLHPLFLFLPILDLHFQSLHLLVVVLLVGECLIIFFLFTGNDGVRLLSVVLLSGSLHIGLPLVDLLQLFLLGCDLGFDVLDLLGHEVPSVDFELHLFHLHICHRDSRIVLHGLYLSLLIGQRLVFRGTSGFQILDFLLLLLSLDFEVFQHLLTLYSAGIGIRLQLIQFSLQRDGTKQQSALLHLQRPLLLLNHLQPLLCLGQFGFQVFTQCLPGIGHTDTALILRVEIVGDEGCLRTCLANHGYRMYGRDELLLLIVVVILIRRDGKDDLRPAVGVGVGSLGIVLLVIALPEILRDLPDLDDHIVVVQTVDLDLLT